MFELTKGREFQLWEYRVSHGSLLIRSPARPASAGRPGFETNVDIICTAVAYLAAPRVLGEITICEGTQPELEGIEEILGKPLHPRSRVWALQNARCRSLVASVFLNVEENRAGLFESPFQLPPLDEFHTPAE